MANTKVYNNSIEETSFSSNNNISLSNSPVIFSPYVVCSRGKSNARKEQQLKRGFSFGRSPSDDIPTKDTVMQSLNISIEEEERTAQYFHFLLNREIDRLTELRKKWIKIRTEPETTKSGKYEINQAIGQINLLISKRFERFRTLVTDCEVGKGEMLVTCKDLQGFWDMMFIEVKNCDSQFEKLEKFRSQGWKDTNLFSDNQITKKKIISAKSNSIKAFLAEKKSKMTEKKIKNNSDSNKLKCNLDDTISNKYIKNESPNIKHKIKSMFTGSNEEKITPLKHAKKLSLLQKVQLSGSLKKIKSPSTIKMNLCKTPEIQLDDSISYINSNQTPGKSILKQSTTKIESHEKSSNKVNFDDHIILNEIPIDEETQIKMDLAAALSRIDNFDFDSLREETNDIRKKLHFNDSNSDEYENDIRQELELKVKIKNNTNNITCMQTQTSISLQELNESICKPQKKNITAQTNMNENDIILNQIKQTLPLNINTSTPYKKDKDDIYLNILKEKHISVSDKEENPQNNECIRVLRNRSISIDTSIVKKKSFKKESTNVQKQECKENETHLDRRKRRSYFKNNINDNEKTDINNYIHDVCLEEKDNKRRSTRSVKFSEIEKEQNKINKSILPVTSYIKKRKISSKTNEKKNTLVENSSEISKKQRIRRSQNKKI
ncbi:guanylate kinase-associated protein mars-like [Apis dorsata]|uniref:guanylate kinase-associated protein mars-like n=1 Tax=Apis dorsata TaxID=7462 RepID=UPI00129323F2|nr:guanylate kinase-associated protein mars-like [Apis dorsata]